MKRYAQKVQIVHFHFANYACNTHQKKIPCALQRYIVFENWLIKSRQRFWAKPNWYDLCKFMLNIEHYNIKKIDIHLTDSQLQYIPGKPRVHSIHSWFYYTCIFDNKIFRDHARAPLTQIGRPIDARNQEYSINTRSPPQTDTNLIPASRAAHTLANPDTHMVPLAWPVPYTYVNTCTQHTD